MLEHVRSGVESGTSVVKVDVAGRVEPSKIMSTETIKFWIGVTGELLSEGCEISGAERQP
jgi:hypothetical protein